METKETKETMENNFGEICVTLYEESVTAETHDDYLQVFLKKVNVILIESGNFDENLQILFLEESNTHLIKTNEIHFFIDKDRVIHIYFNFDIKPINMFYYTSLIQILFEYEFTQTDVKVDVFFNKNGVDYYGIKAFEEMEKPDLTLGYIDKKTTSEIPISWVGHYQRNFSTPDTIPDKYQPIQKDNAIFNFAYLMYKK